MDKKEIMEQKPVYLGFKENTQIPGLAEAVEKYLASKNETAANDSVECEQVNLEEEG